MGQPRQCLGTDQPSVCAGQGSWQQVYAVLALAGQQRPSHATQRLLQCQVSEGDLSVKQSARAVRLLPAADQCTTAKGPY